MQARRTSAVTAEKTTKHGTDVVIYRGDTFRQQIRQYSNDRMQRDPKYRNSVLNAVKARKTKAIA